MVLREETLSGVGDQDGHGELHSPNRHRPVLCRSCRTELGVYRLGEDAGEAQIRAEKAIPIADGGYICVKCWAGWYRKRFVTARRPCKPQNTT
jgi:hypothetical protein